MNFALLGFIVYLILILVVGFITYSRNKSHSDFFIAGRKLNPWVVAFSERASGESAWLLLGLPGALPPPSAPALVAFDSTQKEHVVAGGRASAMKVYGVLCKAGQPDYETSIAKTVRKLAKERVIESAQADGEGVAVIRGVAPGGSVNAGTLHLK